VVHRRQLAGVGAVAAVRGPLSRSRRHLLPPASRMCVLHGPPSRELRRFAAMKHTLHASLLSSTLLLLYRAATALAAPSLLLANLLLRSLYNMTVSMPAFAMTRY